MFFVKPFLILRITLKGKRKNIECHIKLIYILKTASIRSGTKLHVLRVNQISDSVILLMRRNYQAGNYMLKVTNKNARTRCEIYSKLTIKTTEQRQFLYPLKTWFSDVFRGYRNMVSLCCLYC